MLIYLLGELSIISRYRSIISIAYCEETAPPTFSNLVRDGRHSLPLHTGYNKLRLGASRKLHAFKGLKKAVGANRGDLLGIYYLFIPHATEDALHALRETRS